MPERGREISLDNMRGPTEATGRVQKTLVSQEGASVLSWLRVMKNTFNALIRPFVVSRVVVNVCNEAIQSKPTEWK